MVFQELVISFRGVSWGGFGGPGPPGSLNGRQREEEGKGKGKEEREKEEKKGKERRGQKREKIERLIIITRGASFRGGFQMDAGGAPSYFCRDRAPHFVWAPQTKRKHQIVRIDYENYFFSISEGAHPPQTPPVLTGAKVLLVFKFGRPLFLKKSWTLSCHSSASRGFREENFRGAKLTGGGVRATFLNSTPGQSKLIKTGSEG